MTVSVSVDQAIAALRSGHDELAALARGLGPDDLTRPSAASEWDISQVLSHLGSGAEIGLAALGASLAGEKAPDGDFNKGVWARWDAMTPVERGDKFGPANQRLVERYEALDPTQRAELRVNLGFLPEPVDVATAAGFRLNEFALHAWDVKVAFEPTAAVAPEAIPVILEPMAFFLGWISRADAVAGRPATIAVRLTDPDHAFGLRFGDAVTLTEVPPQPDGELRAPAEAWLRLASGRLAARYTPAGVTVTGPLSLDDLRQVFAGY
jgi:uncharacterized protein (TIGR03083 family)